MGLTILVITILVLLFAYRYYTKRKVNQNIEPDWSRSTPARRYMDSVDFIPTQTAIMAGFQFKSISLDLIIGPVIAVQFGWLPAILWLLIGAVFFGWVQDYLVAIMSMRKAGDTLSDLIGSYINPKARSLISIFIFIYLLIILSQFGLLLSTLLGKENVLLSILFLVLAGLLAGSMIYRWRLNLILVTLLSLMIASLGIWVSSIPEIQNIMASINQIILDQDSLTLQNSFLSGEISWHSLIWITILFSICYLGAILPIWQFSVPFNYISSWIVIIGIGFSVIGLILGTFNGSLNMVFEIPALVSSFQPNLGPIWPILFVTLSSGAISGWHSLVASFSTSRQVAKEPLVLPITTGAMFTETVIVAIIIIFAATFGISSGAFNSEQNYSLIAGPASVFATGLARTWNIIGFSESTVGSFSTLFLTLMGITVLQLVLRFARMINADLIGERISVLQNPKLSTLFVIILTLIIVFLGFSQSLWVLFAGANQLLAAIVLLLASTWLVKRKKSFWWTFLPAGFLFMTALAALSYSAIYQALIQQIILGSELRAALIIGNTITIGFGLWFIITGSYLFIIGIRVINQARNIESNN
jgi:carbon starvation protein